MGCLSIYVYIMYSLCICMMVFFVDFIDFQLFLWAFLRGTGIILIPVLVSF